MAFVQKLILSNLSEATTRIMNKQSNLDTQFLTRHLLHTLFLQQEIKKNSIFSYSDSDKFKMEAVGMKGFHSNIVNKICGS